MVIEEQPQTVVEKLVSTVVTNIKQEHEAITEHGSNYATDSHAAKIQILLRVTKVVVVGLGRVPVSSVRPNLYLIVVNLSTDVSVTVTQTAVELRTEEPVVILDSAGSARLKTRIAWPTHEVASEVHSILVSSVVELSAVHNSHVVD